MKSLIVPICLILLIGSVVINIYLLKRNDVPLALNPYPSGNEYTMLLDEKLFFKIGVLNEGKLDYYVSLTESNKKQVFKFFPNGFLQSLIQLNSEDQINGRAYYFSDKSGYLISDYSYVDGVKWGNAVSYYDSTALLRETMLYNQNGELYYKETYSRDGKLINKEGEKD